MRSADGGSEVDGWERRENSSFSSAIMTGDGNRSSSGLTVLRGSDRNPEIQFYKSGRASSGVGFPVLSQNIPFKVTSGSRIFRVILVT